MPVILAGSAIGFAPSQEADGCHSGASAATQVALGTMRSKTPLYVMDEFGRLLKFDLSAGKKTTILSDHGFASMPTLRASADGRWLSYDGVLKSGDKTQYWLYDRHSASERLVYEHPAWGGGIPVFSPDSRYLAISASYDRRWDSARRAGIFVFDTATARLLSITLATKIPIEDAWASTDWSQDGKTLLIMVRAMSGSDEWRYFGFDPATGNTEELSGHYDSRAYRHHFKRGTQAIPAAEELMPPSQVGLDSAWSPDRKRHAYFHNRQVNLPYQLVVANREGMIKTVAVGRYSQCEGHTLAISGWLDERYLVYANGLTRYAIFDAETGATADLFDDNESLRAFTW